MRRDFRTTILNKQHADKVINMYMQTKAYQADTIYSLPIHLLERLHTSQNRLSEVLFKRKLYHLQLYKEFFGPSFVFVYICVYVCMYFCRSRSMVNKLSLMIPLFVRSIQLMTQSIIPDFYTAISYYPFCFSESFYVVFW